jgi:hypothetical protein
MNVNLSCFYNLTISSFKQKIFPTLSPRQKIISLIALAVLASLALAALASYVVYRFAFKAKKNEVEPEKNEQLQLEADYQRLKNQKEVVVNPEELDIVLNILKDSTEELLGPNPPRIGLIHMFDISGKYTKNWEIKLPNEAGDPESQYRDCFEPKKMIEALNVIKAFLIWKFNDRIQKIEVDPGIPSLKVEWKAN